MNDNVKTLFLNKDSKIMEHLSNLNFNRDSYIDTFKQMSSSGSTFTTETYGKVIAVAVHLFEKDFCNYLFTLSSVTLPSILKACEILDSRRLINQLKNKLDQYKKYKIKPKKSKISIIQNKLKLLEILNPEKEFSLTSSKIKIFKKWVNNIPKDKLEFYALTYDLKYWKELADTLHLKSTDFVCEWFVNYVYNKPIPEDCIVNVCKKINQTTVDDYITKYKPDFNFIKNLKLKLNNESKLEMVKYTNIDTVLWWFDEVKTQSVADYLVNQIKEGIEINLPYGLLVSRCIEIKNTYNTLYEQLLRVCDDKLKKYKLSLEQPIVVLGDGSGSMEIAIKTSSIIASILTAICKAELRIFRNKDELISNPPRNVKDVVLFNQYIKAYSSTSPASSIFPYLKDNKKVNTFIIVTDEEENAMVKTSVYNYYQRVITNKNHCPNNPPINMNFMQVYQEYRNKINPAKLIFISFLNNGKEGKMVSQLLKTHPEWKEDIQQFVFDRNDPDLSKLDSVLAKIAMY